MSGLLLGAGVVFFGTLSGSVVLVAIGGALANGGPVVALTLVVHRRLDIASLPGRAATLWGVAGGLVAVVLATVIELALPAAVFAGPAEEGSKLLLPVVLLFVGPVAFRNPRLGIWLVTVSGATFGIIEGVLYVVAPYNQLRAGSALDHGASMLVVVGNRPWVELLHVVLTAGAAAVIWLAAHRARRRLTWTGFAGFAIAAAFHSFNDAVLAPVGGIVGAVLVSAGLVLMYFFWFRPRVRAAVPPNMLATVPQRWLPTLSRQARASAVAPAVATGGLVDVSAPTIEGSAVSA